MYSDIQNSLVYLACQNIAGITCISYTACLSHCTVQSLKYTGYISSFCIYTAAKMHKRSFFNYDDQILPTFDHLPLVDIAKGISFVLQGKICISLTFQYTTETKFWYREPNPRSRYRYRSRVFFPKLNLFFFVFNFF